LRTWPDCFAQHSDFRDRTAAPVLALAVAEWIQMLEDAPVSRWLRNLARGLRGMGDSIGGMEGQWRTHLVSAAAVVLVTAILYAPAPPANFRARFDGKEFPAKALASLGDSAAQSRIFTYDQWGDFLIYKLYPKNQVFIDGRSDFYGRNSWKSTWISSASSTTGSGI
jgi:hypothetical protein